MDEPNSTGTPPTSTPSESKPETSAPAPIEQSTSEAPKNEKAPANTFRRELALAIVQHANRAIVILLIAWMVGIGIFWYRKDLAAWLSNAESIKAWSFEVRLRQAATYQQVNAEFARLAELTDQELQLFLILGKERGTTAAGPFDIAYKGEEVSKENLEKLQDIGLLTGVIEKPGKIFEWQVTDQGKKLHRLLLGHVVNSIKSAAQGPCEAS